jgi:hypothetical protein
MAATVSETNVVMTVLLIVAMMRMRSFDRNGVYIHD